MGKERGDPHSNSTAKHWSIASSPMTDLAGWRGRHHREHTGKPLEDRAELKDSFLLWVASMEAADSNTNHLKDAVLRALGGTLAHQPLNWHPRKMIPFHSWDQNHQQTLQVRDVLSIEFASIFLVKSVVLKSQWASEQPCSYTFLIKWEDPLWLQHGLGQFLTEHSKGFLNHLGTA